MVRKQDIAELIWLSAIWGASFLFMRIAVPEFGVFALVALRVMIGALVLLPVAIWSGALPSLRQYWWRIMIVGLLTSALPFTLFAYASQSITAGFSSILNATAPFWAALIAWIWLKDHLGASRVVGLVIGFGGVVWLTLARGSFSPDAAPLAVLACMLATGCYGLAASYSKRYLGAVHPVAAAAGSQISATLALCPFALAHLPSSPVSLEAWGAALSLGVLCTGIAYVSYFRLIRNIGPSRAIAVTFVIPVFGVLWGAVFLAERVNASMMFGGAIILLGTALTTGILTPSGRSRATK